MPTPSPLTDAARLEALAAGGCVDATTAAWLRGCAARLRLRHRAARMRRPMPAPRAWTGAAGRLPRAPEAWE